MEILNRIKNYLGNGGLFNPELMDHQKVMDLIIDSRDVIENLKNNLSVCESDYWFMINLLEKYGVHDKDQAIKDCIERMRLRKPIFKVIKNETKKN